MSAEGNSFEDLCRELSEDELSESSLSSEACSHRGHSSEACPRNRFSHDETEKLLEVWCTREFQQRLNSVRNPQKKGALWEEVASKVGTKTADQCKNRASYLKKKYKECRARMKQTGHGKVKWRYYDEIDDVFAQRPCVGGSGVMRAGYKGEDGEVIPSTMTDGSPIPAAFASHRRAAASDSRAEKKRKRDEMMKKMEDHSADSTTMLATLIACFKDWEARELERNDLLQERHNMEKERHNMEKERQNMEEERQNMEEERHNMERERQKMERERQEMDLEKHNMQMLVYERMANWFNGHAS